MTIIPIFLDCVPDYLRSEDGRHTLLLTPVGPRRLIQTLRDSVAGLTEEAPSVLWSGAKPRPAYGADVKVIRNIEEVTGRAEPSDWLLLADPLHFPTDATEYSTLGENLSAAGEARYLAAIDSSGQGMREFIQFDDEQRVRRVHRLYEGVTWLRTRAVVAALVPVCAACEIPSDSMRDMALMRRRLTARGVVSRDRTVRGTTFDLDQEADMLRLCELLMRQAAAEAPPPGFVCQAPGVWASESCRIHPTARIHGPVILHEGVSVEEGATLIGPVMVGADSRVRAGSVLAECLIMPGAETSPGEAVRFRVFQGGQAGTATPAANVSSSWIRADRTRAITPPRAAENGAARRERRVFLTFKRAIDCLIALFALIVLSPVMLLTAAAVKLTSRGSVFFCHEREGLDGAHFPCRKYRTMAADAHSRQRELYDANAVDGPQFKMEHDPRITPIGRFLRKTNLDELPQLFNVLSGQMSLIGPRPSPFRENQICVPWREARLAVRPGITGLWQVCRHERDAGDFHQWIEYDMLYVRHMSFGLDLKIIAATLLTLGGRWSVPVSWIVPASQQVARRRVKRRTRKKTPTPESASGRHNQSPESRRAGT